MYNRNENKPKAVWTKLHDIGSFSIAVSNGGAVKIEDDGGKVVAMFPARQLEVIHLVMTSLSAEQLTSTIDTATHNKALKQEVVQIEKEMNKNQAQSIKFIQANIDYKRAKGQDTTLLEGALLEVLKAA